MHFLRPQRNSATPLQVKYDADEVVKQALERAMTLELSVDKTVELILAFLRGQDWLRNSTERAWYESPSLNTKVNTLLRTDNERIL
jgi:hypothetical protein